MEHSSTRRGIARRKAATGLMACVVGALAAPHVARAAVRTARFGHNNPDNSQIGRGLLAFAAAVAADPVLNSVLKVDVYPNAQLGDDLNMLKSCAKSTIDGALIGSSIISNMVPEMGIVNAPYLFKDAAQARTVLDGAAGHDFTELARRKDLPVLAWGENGLRQLTSNRPVQNPADLRGLKIRVPQSDIMIGGFRALGANAAPLAFPLVRDALRSGEFEAQENAISTIESSKLYEVQKYLCLTGHIYDAAGFIASQDLLEDLTDAQRRALVVCAQTGAVATRSAGDIAARDGIGRLKAAGMTVIDTVDLAAFKAAARPYLESLAGTFGAERVASLLAAGA